MPRQDFYIKKLLQDPARFADLYNAEIFHGKQILKAELLSPVSTESGIAITNRSGRRQTIQRRRDIAMKASIGACFIVAGCEAQGEIHYGMPIRSLTYDALDYTEQLTEIQKEHRKKKDLTKSPEFLSGIIRRDKLQPVLTLVLYCGKDPWDGPKSLYDMLDLRGPTECIPDLLAALPDYRINLVDIRKIENLSLYKTGLQQVFGMLKYSAEKSKFYNYITSNHDQISMLDDNALTAVMGLLGENRRLMKYLAAPGREEGYTMCQAIDDLIADGKLEGKREGEKEGEVRMASLISILLKENRLDLIAEISGNEQLRRQLFQHYHL
ncbi:MAG: Rpn family recombination-promoting nuclease/putative transposase [Clostridiaceae bacterium]|nr:Rpn family recombination-promoting nuclease/putative transposase [Clostridiaceae bacterium]